MKSPKILEIALRQYQHNDCSGMVKGFDYKETIRIFNIIDKALKAQSILLLAYQTGITPSEWVFDDIRIAREIGIEI